MKRALIVAVTAALFAGLLGGFASAQTTTDATAADAAPAVRADDSGDADVRSMWKRCRDLFGDDDLTPAAKERCIELWKRWCNAHPDARRCHRPDVRPHDCHITDRVVDRRCVHNRPSDRPTDRPVVRPSDRPSDKPVDTPPKDRIRDRVSDRPTDRTGNDIHLRTRSADL